MTNQNKTFQTPILAVQFDVKFKTPIEGQEIFIVCNNKIQKFIRTKYPKEAIDKGEDMTLFRKGRLERESKHLDISTCSTFIYKNFYWSARIVDHKTHKNEFLHAAFQYWNLEIVFSQDHEQRMNDEARLSFYLSFADETTNYRTFQNRPSYSIPRLIRNLLQDEKLVCISDCLPLRADAWHIGIDIESSTIEEYINNVSRRLPVVLFPGDEESASHFATQTAGNSFVVNGSKEQIESILRPKSYEFESEDIHAIFLPPKDEDGIVHPLYIKQGKTEKLMNNLVWTCNLHLCQDIVRFHTIERRQQRYELLRQNKEKMIVNEPYLSNKLKDQRFSCITGPQSLFDRIWFILTFANPMTAVDITEKHFQERVVQREIPKEVLDKLQNFSMAEWTLMTADVTSQGKFMCTGWTYQASDGYTYYVPIAKGNKAITVMRKDDFDRNPRYLTNGELFDKVDSMNTELMKQIVPCYPEAGWQNIVAEAYADEDACRFSPNIRYLRQVNGNFLAIDMTDESIIGTLQKRIDWPEISLELNIKETQYV